MSDREIAMAQQVRRIKETHYYPKSAWLMHLILMEALLPVVNSFFDRLHVVELVQLLESIHAFGEIPLALALKKTS